MLNFGCSAQLNRWNASYRSWLMKRVKRQDREDQGSSRRITCECVQAEKAELIHNTPCPVEFLSVPTLSFATYACFISIYSKQTINTVPTLDFLRDLVSAIPDPIIAEPKPSNTKHRNTTTIASTPRPKRARKSRTKPSSEGEGEGDGRGDGDRVEGEAEAEPTILPDTGTWKTDMEGEGGTGQDGKGFYDDYEEDEDDY